VTEWRKSSRSGGVNDEACVELARIDGTVGVRDSKHPNGPRILIPKEKFAALLAAVKRNELDA
jgi:hypothetical protein